MAAARGYAGLSHAALGKRLNVSRDTVQRAESGEGTFHVHEAEAWLRRVAEACEVPYPFFVISFDKLKNIAVGKEIPLRTIDLEPSEATEENVLAIVREQSREVMDALHEHIDQEFQRLIEDRFRYEDSTREAVSAMRSISGAAKDQVAGDGSENPAAADTRDEADATPADARVPREARR